MLDPGQKYGTSPVRLDGALRQSLGNLAASAIAGILWTAVSPTAAFIYAAVWMFIELLAFTATRVAQASPQPAASRRR